MNPNRVYSCCGPAYWSDQKLAKATMNFAAELQDLQDPLFKVYVQSLDPVEQDQIWAGVADLRDALFTCIDLLSARGDVVVEGARTAKALPKSLQEALANGQAREWHHLNELDRAVCGHRNSVITRMLLESMPTHPMLAH